MIDSPQADLASLQEVLDSLTADELRDVVLALRGPEAILGRKKEELVAQAASAGPRDKVEETAARVEALTPRKHLWLFSITGPTPIAASNLFSDWTDAVAGRAVFRRIRDLEQGSPNLQLRLQLYDFKSEVLYLKYDHWVTTESWRKTGPRNKVLTTDLVRHSVTVACKPQQGILEVRFDGYTQGLAIEATQRIPYREVAVQASSAAAKTLDLTITPISLQVAVERLLDTAPEEVKDVRRNTRTAHGFELGLKSQDGQDIDVATDLAEFLRVATGNTVSVSREEIRKALRSTPADSVLLFWNRLELLTRVTNHDIGPELLFVWRSSNRTTGAISYVVEALLSAYRAIGKPTPEMLAKQLADLAPGETLRVSDAMARWGADADTSLKALEEARASGFLTRVFRVRTSAVLHDYVNSWKVSPFEIPSIVTDEEGRKIGSEDPSNIEVGYTRRGDV